MSAQYIPENMTYEFLQEDYMEGEKYFLTIDDGTMAEDKEVLFCADIRSQLLDLLEADFDRGEQFSDSMCLAQQLFMEKEGLV